MKLIAPCIALVVAGDFVAQGVGCTIELSSPAASLPVFLTMFFLVFWAGWKAAIRLT